MATSNLSRLINESISNSAYDKSFLNDLKYVVSKISIDKNKEPSHYYHPSSMNCVRNMYFQRTGAELDPLKPNPCSIGIAESGTDRHERIQAYISNMQKFGVDCKWVKVSDYLSENPLNVDLSDLEIIKEDKFETLVYNRKYHIRFKCDGIIIYKGKYFILEIKTETSYKFLQRTCVADEHCNQSCAYVLSFKIPDVMFLYENRDICDWKTYQYSPAKILIEEKIVKPIEICEECISNNTIPKVPKVLPKNTCTYCQYTKMCKIAEAMNNE